jgi:hypothetical protein
MMTRFTTNNFVYWSFDEIFLHRNWFKLRRTSSRVKYFCRTIELEDFIFPHLFVSIKYQDAKQTFRKNVCRIFVARSVYST